MRETSCHTCHQPIDQMTIMFNSCRNSGQHLHLSGAWLASADQGPCWQTILAQYWTNIDKLGPYSPILQYWANVGAILCCQCSGVAILANVGAIVNNNKQWQNFNADDLGTKILRVCRQKAKP